MKPNKPVQAHKPKHVIAAIGLRRVASVTRRVIALILHASLKVCSPISPAQDLQKLRIAEVRQPKRKIVTRGRARKTEIRWGGIKSTSRFIRLVCLRLRLAHGLTI